VRVLDLFSGIGGFSLGLERTGMRTVAFCEIDGFCRKVLAKHWPGVPILGDVTDAEFPDADIIVGGFPCQDVSCAGKRAGIAGKRSGLYRQLVRALRVVRPRHAIVENVAALLADGMGIVLGDMAESGFDLEWDCVPASAVGAPHERDRVWIVAHDNSGDVYGCRHDPGYDGRRQREAAELPRCSGDGIDPATDAPGQQMGLARQPRLHGGLGSGIADAESDGCGQGRSRRPPDSFSRVRDEARRNIADPYSARLAFRAGLTRDAWEKLSPPERDRLSDGGQSLWPDEPALSGVDDVIPDWMDRVKTTGNAVVPLIPELIGEALMTARDINP